MKGLLSLLVCFSCFAAVGNAQDLVINELIYDDDGADDACWLELKGPPGFPLNGYRLIGINGAGGGEYQPILLDGHVIPPDGYFLIVQTAGMPNGDMVSANVNYQNGDDSVQLQVQGPAALPAWVVVDAVGYGTFMAGEIFAGEGTPAPDVTGSGVSLARCPDGRDTNDNGADFMADTNPTPGAMNMGDCEPHIGACCFIDGSCEELSPDDCAAAGAVYQGDDTTCDPNPCTPMYPTNYNCCELADDNPATGRPLHEGEWIRVDGIVLMESWLWAANRTEFTITDESGCCVNVFKGDQAISIVRGDEVEVIGTLGFFNGKTQVTTPNMTITVLSSGNPIPDPWPVTTAEFAANGEAYESCLLKFTCVTITGGTWPAEGSDANITVDDGSGPATLRIDRDTNIDGSEPPQGQFSAIGIGGQYDTTEPYFQGYQMNPRDINDILYFDCPVSGACCFGEVCVVLLDTRCLEWGGTWMGAPTCVPNPCRAPAPGACCFDHMCYIMLEEECRGYGGLWDGYYDCYPNPCPQNEQIGAPCPPGGLDQFDETHAAFLFDAPGMGLGPRPIIASGPTTVLRRVRDFFGDGHCEIQTEMLQLDLVGTFNPDCWHPEGERPVSIRLDPISPTLGTIASSNDGMGNPAFPDDSFFDVFVEVDIEGIGIFPYSVAQMGNLLNDGDLWADPPCVHPSDPYRPPSNDHAHIPCPDSLPPTGCCIVGTNEFYTYLVLCDALGGTYLGDGSVCPVTGVVDEIAGGIRIGEITPNPSSGTVRLTYRLESTARAQIDLFDGSGRLVRSFAVGEQGIGEHEFVWDGKDRQGRDLPAGVYFLTLRSGEMQTTRGIVLLR